MNFFPELLLWFFININDADWKSHPITCIIKDNSGLHYGLPFQSLCISYQHINKHVILNRIFLQMGSWTHCVTLSDGKKYLVWLNYLNHWPQCPMRALPLYDIPGAYSPFSHAGILKASGSCTVTLHADLWRVNVAPTIFVSANLLALFVCLGF